MKDTDTKVKYKLFLMRRKETDNFMGTINSKKDFMHKLYVMQEKREYGKCF